MEVRDKVAIVTGAAGGIGEALTHRFLEAGARVLVSDIDVDKLHATAGRLEQVAGAGTVAAVAGDAADPFSLICPPTRRTDIQQRHFDDF